MRKVLFLLIIVSVIFFAGCNKYQQANAQDKNSTDSNVTIDCQYYFNRKVKIKHETYKDSATGKEIQSIHTQYDKNGNICDKEEYLYDLKTGTRTCIIYEKYNENGTVIQKNEFFFDSKTGAMTGKTQTVYRQNGEISYSYEFNYTSGWERPVSSIKNDYFNGKLFSKEEEYWDIKTHEKIRSKFTMYNNDGSIRSQEEEKY